MSLDAKKLVVWFNVKKLTQTIFKSIYKLEPWKITIINYSIIRILNFKKLVKIIN